MLMRRTGLLLSRLTRAPGAAASSSAGATPAPSMSFASSPRDVSLMLKMSSPAAALEGAASQLAERMSTSAVSPDTFSRCGALRAEEREDSAGVSRTSTPRGTVMVSTSLPCFRFSCQGLVTAS